MMCCVDIILFYYLYKSYLQLLSISRYTRQQIKQITVHLSDNPFPDNRFSRQSVSRHSYPDDLIFSSLLLSNVVRNSIALINQRRSTDCFVSFIFTNCICYTFINKNYLGGIEHKSGECQTRLERILVQIAFQIARFEDILGEDFILY